MAKWQETEKKMERNAANLPALIDLNVGGQKFSISKETLMQTKGSYFEAMLSTNHSQQRTDGKVFIDRDPKYFGSLLHFVRTGQVRTENNPREFALEFEFYKIPMPLPLQSLKGSELLTQYEHKQKFSEWLPKAQFTLIYKGSRDGFAATKFHQNCDNKGPTVTVIKSKNGYIFGGYTSQSWDSSGSYKPDNKAFLFTLTNPHDIPPTQFPINPNEVHEAIKGTANACAIFGKGKDIRVADAANQNNDSYASLYSYPDTTGKKNLIFTGDMFFTVSELEVYSVS